MTWTPAMNEENWRYFGEIINQLPLESLLANGELEWGIDGARSKDRGLHPEATRVYRDGNTAIIISDSPIILVHAIVQKAIEISDYLSVKEQILQRWQGDARTQAIWALGLYGFKHKEEVPIWSQIFSDNDIQNPTRVSLNRIEILTPDNYIIGLDAIKSGVRNENSELLKVIVKDLVRDIDESPGFRIQLYGSKLERYGGVFSLPTTESVKERAIFDILCERKDLRNFHRTKDREEYSCIFENYCEELYGQLSEIFINYSNILSGLGKQIFDFHFGVGCEPLSEAEMAEEIGLKEQHISSIVHDLRRDFRDSPFAKKELSEGIIARYII